MLYSTGKQRYYLILARNQPVRIIYQMYVKISDFVQYLAVKAVQEHKHTVKNDVALGIKEDFKLFHITK